MNVHSRPQQQTPVLLMVLLIAGSAELVAERLAQKPLCCATTWPRASLTGRTLVQGKQPAQFL